MNENEPDELPLAAPVYAAKKAEECLRMWQTDGKLFVILRPSTFEDPFGWGIALADAAQHIARACTHDGALQREGPDGEVVIVSREEVVDRIREGFDAELDSPTDEAKQWKPDA